MPPSRVGDFNPSASSTEGGHPPEKGLLIPSKEGSETRMGVRVFLADVCYSGGVPAREFCQYFDNPGDDAKQVPRISLSPPPGMPGGSRVNFPGSPLVDHDPLNRVGLLGQKGTMVPANIQFLGLNLACRCG